MMVGFWSRYDTINIVGHAAHLSRQSNSPTLQSFEGLLMAGYLPFLTTSHKRICVHRFACCCHTWNAENYDPLQPTPPPLPEKITAKFSEFEEIFVAAAIIFSQISTFSLAYLSYINPVPIEYT